MYSDDVFGKYVSLYFLFPFIFSLLFLRHVCSFSRISFPWKCFSLFFLSPSSIWRVSYFPSLSLTLFLSYSSCRLIPPFPWYHHLTNRYHDSLVHLLCNVVDVFDKMSNRPRKTSLRPRRYGDIFLSGPTPTSLPSLPTSKNSYFNSIQLVLTFVYPCIVV